MSFHLNPINANEDYVEKIQRIYIDPEELIALKTKRKSFAMVPSIYQPPEEDLSFKEQASYNYTTDYSFMKNKTISHTGKRFSKNFYQEEKEEFPQ